MVITASSEREYIRPEYINPCNDKIRCNGHTSYLVCIESRIHLIKATP